VTGPGGGDRGSGSRGGGDRAGGGRGIADRAGADRGDVDRGDVDRGDVDRAGADRGSADRGDADRAGAERGSVDRASGEPSGGMASAAVGLPRARARFRVIGLVQGVWFRQAAADQGNRLGLAGRVRNRADGSVEGEAEGPREAVEALLRWSRRGPPAARVDAVEVEWEAPREETGPFRVDR
jgi:acylphosphatase